MALMMSCCCRVQNRMDKCRRRAKRGRPARTPWTYCSSSQLVLVRAFCRSNCRIKLHQLGNSDTAIFIHEYISGGGAIIILDLIFKNFPDVSWQSLYWDLALNLANVYIGVVNTFISLTNWSHCTTSHTTSTTLWCITHGMAPVVALLCSQGRYVGTYVCTDKHVEC